MDLLRHKLESLLADQDLHPSPSSAFARASSSQPQFTRQTTKGATAFGATPTKAGSYDELNSTFNRAMSMESCIDAGDSSMKPTFLLDLDEKRKHQDGKLVKHEQQLLALIAKVDTLERKVREQQTQLSSKNDAAAALEARMCRGVFYWRIKDFSVQRQEARVGALTVLHSSGFYTSFYGYKLCIRANLNGVDGGNGSHISVFIHFMRGDFDDIVEWPFKGRITLSILDQGEHKQHIVEVLESKPSLAAFQRPLSNRNHKGFGYIEFAPIALIENSSYTKNDTLIIKAEVTEM